MRITSTPGFYNRKFAYHPSDTAVCVRIDGTKALIMWHNGSLQVPIKDVPTSWWTPRTAQGVNAPLRVKRPLLGAAYSTLDVEFLSLQQAQGASSVGRSFLLSFLSALAG